MFLLNEEVRHASRVVKQITGLPSDHDYGIPVISDTPHPHLLSQYVACQEVTDQTTYCVLPTGRKICCNCVYNEIITQIYIICKYKRRDVLRLN